MSKETLIKASHLIELYTKTKQQYDHHEPNNSHAALTSRVEDCILRNHNWNLVIPQAHVKAVVHMYLDAQTGLAPSYPTRPHLSSASSAFSLPSSRNTSNSWFSGMPGFTYVDNSWRTYNTTNNNPSSSSNTNNKKEDKESSAEAMLLMLAVGVILSIVTFIAAVSFGHLFSELANHVDRVFNNDSAIQASFLLMGVGASYCLAMLSIYQVAGTLLMATMVTAGFANPAVWAFSAIALSAIIATPAFNMLIREGIYSLFSLFDNQALVSTDNRFRMLTQAEVDSLDDNIDPNRINFATLCKYDELKPTQIRQRFAFFDYNSPEMNNVLKETRAMRHATPNNSTVDIKLPGAEAHQTSFSLFKATKSNNPAPSAPPAVAQAEACSLPIATVLYT